MPNPHLVCTRHFAIVVANSSGTATCRACGRNPTPAEEAQGIATIVQWEAARDRAKAPKQSR